MAIPRVASHGGAGVALPQPLPPSEAGRIRQIFILQAHGHLEVARRELKAVDTTTPLGEAMLGHILADRYLGHYSRPGAKELGAWLARWPDLPQAAAIHALLVARLPREAKPPPAPHVPAPIALPRFARMPDEADGGDAMPARNPKLERSVHAAAKVSMAGAQRLLARTGGLNRDYDAQLRGEAARILFAAGRDEEALAIAAPGARTCVHSTGTCDGASLAGITAGLAAWRMHRPETAQTMFEAAWHARRTTPTDRAAAAFWAARTHLHDDDGVDYVQWMLRASSERNTFYGLLARRSLGLGIGPLPDGVRETLSEADVDAVAATPQGLRAFALLQVGQPEHAEAELRGLWPGVGNMPLARAIMLVADSAGLSEFAAQLADLLAARGGRQHAATRFAVPRLRPERGFTVDPALIYGITRVESGFNPAVVSSEGARGLMQIMPDTASFLVGRPVSASLRRALHDPGYNLDLGQRYVRYLSRHELVGGDLIRLLICYNAGPGHFARWAVPVRDEDDPLLFIESIPSAETRAYVPRVLTNTWLFAARLHLPTPSLDELAAGRWPRYHSLQELQEPLPRLH
jgi:soluble lytic murein transglycosylase-like protein